jgi:riboflavin biosynthesis pyrimidine reductase
MVDITSVLPDLAGALDDTAIGDHYSAGAATQWLRVNFVSSVDGAVTIEGKSGGLGGDADRRVFDLLRTLCDVVVVASGTVKTEGYGAMVLDEESVSVRVAAGLAPQPVFAIVSGSLDLDPASDIFTKAPVRPLVITHSSAPLAANAALAKVADILVCGEGSVDRSPWLPRSRSVDSCASTARAGHRCSARCSPRMWSTSSVSPSVR